MSERESKDPFPHLPIDQRVEHVEQQLFWRYFVSRALQLALMIIQEEVSDAIVGLLLPLQLQGNSALTPHPEEVSKLGESLVGWIGQHRSFAAFLAPVPSFEYPSDFRIFPLQTGKEERPQDNTLIVVQRKAKSLSPSVSVVETIRALLAPLYTSVQEWQHFFSQGMRDVLEPATDFDSGINMSSGILSGFADMVVRLGGLMSNGQRRWRFSCILLPKDLTLPMQQRSLIVYAQSQDSPHEVGETTVVAHESSVCLSLRAFQSGRIIYRSEIVAEDATIAFRESEGPIHSAVAIPIGAENGLSVGVLYVASDEPNAFSVGDRRLLRVIGAMIEELLRQRTRPGITEKFVKLLQNPDIVDTSFGEFESENDFVSDVKAILTDVKTHMQERAAQAEQKGLSLAKFDKQHPEEHLFEAMSFIAIDMDNQSDLASKYGDKMARNLSREIGLRIQGQIRGLLRESPSRTVYHAYADRFYVLLKGTTLIRARQDAERLRNALNGPYRIDARRASLEEPRPAGGLIELSHVTVRLGVASYTYSKLEQILQQYSDATAVSAIIIRSLEESLKLGRDEGGNVVISWDLTFGRFVRWTPEDKSWS